MSNNQTKQIIKITRIFGLLQWMSWHLLKALQNDVFTLKTYLIEINILLKYLIAGNQIFTRAR